ncbi:hypothetical protein [Streptomyces sp. GC420]|uniref:hypothetical protein n=1 Tax=Streptomyces sp. GC420 TaxID=2697568 RepID=UPI0014152944|nr:hypothetical protein [Streptomyces sp. GC420]NBM21128.1 hypothetical protein [Streptomyces sp. GC420]
MQHELVLRVDAGPDAAPEQLERQTHGLYQDLRTLGLLRVQLRQASPATGTAPVTDTGAGAGALVLTGAFSSAAAKALGNVLIASMQRSGAPAVHWEFEGRAGSFAATSATDRDALVEAVTARTAAADG